MREESNSWERAWDQDRREANLISRKIVTPPTPQVDADSEIDVYGKQAGSAVRRLCDVVRHQPAAGRAIPRSVCQQVKATP